MELRVGALFAVHLERTASQQVVDIQHVTMLFKVHIHEPEQDDPGRFVAAHAESFYPNGGH